MKVLKSSFFPGLWAVLWVLILVVGCQQPSMTQGAASPRSVTNIPQGSGIPFSLTSYSTWGPEHHNLYRDLNNQLSDIWYDGIREKWRYQNLSRLVTEAPVLAGNPTAVIYRGWLHQLYRDSANRIADIWGRPEGWRYQNLSSLVSGAPKAAGDPTSIVYHDGHHTLYRDVNETISDIWFDSQKWRYQNLNALVSGAPRAASDVVSLIFNDQHHNFYVDRNGNVSDIWYDGARLLWRYDSITTNAVAPLAKVYRPSAVNWGIQMHVSYVDRSGELSDLWFDGSLGRWKWQFISSVSPAVPTGPPSGVIINDQEHYIFAGRPRSELPTIADPLWDVWYDSIGWHSQKLGTVLPGVSNSLGNNVTTVVYQGQFHNLFFDENARLVDLWFDSPYSTWKYQQLDTLVH